MTTQIRETKVISRRCGSCQSHLDKTSNGYRCAFCGRVYEPNKSSAPAAFGASLEDYKRRVGNDPYQHLADFCEGCGESHTHLCKYQKQQAEVRVGVTYYCAAGCGTPLPVEGNDDYCSEQCAFNATEPPYNANAYVCTAADMETAILNALESQEKDGILVERLTAWLKSINAYDENMPISEQCRRAVDLAVAAERGACAKVASGFQSQIAQVWEGGQAEIRRFESTKSGIATAIRARSESPQEEGKRLTDLYPDGMFLDGAGNILNQPASQFHSVPSSRVHRPFGHLGQTQGKDTRSSAVKPVIRSDEGKRAVVGDIVYGITADCCPVRYPNIERVEISSIDLAFAQPVATYIREQGWKWEEVQVREYPLAYSIRREPQIGFINTVKSIVLVYHVERDCWSSPIAI